MKKTLAIAVAFLILSGCAPTSTVREAKGSESISTLALTCSNYYEFTRDCSIWSGATRTVEINGFEVNVASTDDGKTLLVMDANFHSNVLLSDFLMLNSPTHSKASNSSFRKIKEALEENNVNINKVIPLESFGNIDGYILELDKDGYSPLLPYTQE